MTMKNNAHVFCHEELPKAFPWLTDNRSFAIAGAIAAVGIYMGWMA